MRGFHQICNQEHNKENDGHQASKIQGNIEFLGGKSSSIFEKRHAESEQRYSNYDDDQSGKRRRFSALGKGCCVCHTIKF